jgi:hypothetical protein
LIAALWATINGCSASVTDRGGWCVAAPSNAIRLAPRATIVNGQISKNEPQQAGGTHASGSDRTCVSASHDCSMDGSMRRFFRTERACDGHHVNAADHLRAGTVKARRPRGRAVGAKRRALHGAEHRCSIVVVMADGVDVAPDVITSTAASRHRMQPARTTISWTASGHASAHERGQFAANISGRTGPDRPEDRSHNRARSMQQTRGASRRRTCCVRQPEATVTAMA